jgi:hypothetical protein
MLPLVILGEGLAYFIPLAAQQLCRAIMMEPKDFVISNVVRPSAVLLGDCFAY